MCVHGDICTSDSVSGGGWSWEGLCHPQGALRKKDVGEETGTSKKFEEEKKKHLCGNWALLSTVTHTLTSV